ncbi:hypothetical protein LCGC14_0351790 [marine sediment metagenome]|uniref:Uncharacterized protein n=1 Tax=marine sediment metagenome TaxID=412755 RepID=A0A0F9TAU3_9ZZZZ
MLLHPCTDSGQLQSEISEIRRKVDGKADSHEISSLRGKLDSLEHSVREISTLVNGFELRLQELEEDKRQLMESETF